MNTQPLISVECLSKHFHVGPGQTLHAVDEVSLDVFPGETVGLVGESGCGKSTLGRVLTRMHSQTAGVYRLRGEEVPARPRDRDRRRLSREIQMIFQDPYASLNPRMTVGDIIAEGPTIHGLWRQSDRAARVGDWLTRVGLVPEHAARFPHEFSGGQRQRIGIARALAVEPRVVVCDEPISALDVSVQAQIVMLLKRLQREMSLTYLFIAHGLHMVRYVSDRIAVMYLGRLVEIGPSQDLFARPLHPYSKALIAANPFPDPARERARVDEVLRGEVTSPVNPKPGCRFAPRCPFATEECRRSTPTLREVEPGRSVACHHTEA